MTKEHGKMQGESVVMKRKEESSVQIANPIYDVVFKFLLDDNRIAKKFLSLLTGKKIVTLNYKPTELRNTLNKDGTFTVLHIDFSAVVVLEDGTQEHIIIELQKALYFADIQRFRRYLGSEYANPDNTYTRDGKKRAMPIYTIYFLGSPLQKTTAPIITATTVVKDAFTGEVIKDHEEFIHALTHEGLFIQIPYLKDKRRNELERVLSVFDSTKGKNHFLDIDEHMYPEEYGDIIRRLQQACSEKTIRDTMICEDEILAELADLERTIAAKDKALNEQKITISRAVKKLAKALDISEEEAQRSISSRD